MTVDHARYQICGHDLHFESVARMLQGGEQLFGEPLGIVYQLQCREVRCRFLFFLIHLLFALFKRNKYINIQALFISVCKESKNTFLSALLNFRFRFLVFAARV